MPHSRTSCNFGDIGHDRENRARKMHVLQISTVAEKLRVEVIVAAPRRHAAAKPLTGLGSTRVRAMHAWHTDLSTEVRPQKHRFSNAQGGRRPGRKPEEDDHTPT